MVEVVEMPQSVSDSIKAFNCSIMNLFYEMKNCMDGNGTIAFGGLSAVVNEAMYEIAKDEFCDKEAK